METFLNNIKSILQTDATEPKEIIEYISYQKHREELKQQILSELEKLDLDDYFDVLDQIFQHDEAIYETELIQILLQYCNKAKLTYYYLVDQPRKQADDEEQTFLTQEAFTSADCASVCQFLCDLLAYTEKLKSETYSTIFYHCYDYFANFYNHNTTISSFYFQLAHFLILIYLSQNSELALKLIQVSYEIAIKEQQPSSNVILYVLTVFGFKDIPQSVLDYLTEYIIIITKRSREYLLAVVASYNMLVVERHVKLEYTLGHKILGYNVKISTGVASLVDYLSVQNECNDQAPAMLLQFLIIQAKSDQRVAKLIAQQPSVYHWMTDIMALNDDRWTKLVIEFGKILLRCGNIYNDDCGAEIMRIISNKSLKTPAVDLDTHM